MKTYIGNITKLERHQIFVFGSNTQGRHGRGAALAARLHFGAKNGEARGLHGQSYGIVTKNLLVNIHPSVSPFDIISQIDRLYAFAIINPDKEFFVAYKGSGYNLNGYTPEQMASYFSAGVLLGHSKVPDNIVFEEEFSKMVIHSRDNVPVGTILDIDNNTFIIPKL